MNRTYLAHETNIVSALNEIDNFIGKMEDFMNKYPGFKYDIKITKTSDQLYEIKLNVTNNESDNNKLL